MSTLIVLGLVIQAIAICLIFARLGRTWPRHIGAIFVVIAVLYHGVGEIFMALFPGQDPYRPLIQPRYVDRFVVLISVGILLFAIAYVSAIGRRPSVRPSPQGSDALLTIRLFNWRLMLLITIPLLVLTVGGQGYLSNGGVRGTGGVASTIGFVQQFFIIAIVLSAFGLVMRFGQRWILPVLAAQSLAMALVGERAVLIFGAVMLLYVLSKFGARLGHREMAVGFAVLLIFAWVITSARAAEGRFNTTAASSLRLNFIADGLSNLTSTATRHEIAFTFGYRLDGNSFGALEVQALENGSSPVGLAPLKNDLLVAVPSFLNPNKDSSDIGTRVEKDYVAEHLPLTELIVPGGFLDILPTQLGGLTGIIGVQLMLLVSILLGLAFAAIDLWLRRGLGPIRTLISLGLLYCVLDYEGSWDTYTTTARGIVLLVIIIGALLGIRHLAGERGFRHVSQR